MGEVKKIEHPEYRMIKKEIEKEDGRYLIYYRFVPVKEKANHQADSSRIKDNESPESA